MLRSLVPVGRFVRAISLLAFMAFAAAVSAQTCFTDADLDAATKSSLDSSAARFFQYAAAGDYASLKQNSTGSVASGFNPGGALVNTIAENKANFQGAQP